MSKRAELIRPVDVTLRLQSASTEAQRRALVRKAWKTCEEFFIGIDMSMDTIWTMPVTSVPEIQDIDHGEPGSFNAKDFCILRDLLSKATPADARELLWDAADRANITEWNSWYRRILLQRLHLDLPMQAIVSELKQLTK